MIPTIFGGDTGKTQGDIDDQRKRLAYAMLQQGMDMSPVQSPWQGAARLAQALMGGLAIRQQEKRAGAAEGLAASRHASNTSSAVSPDEAFNANTTQYRDIVERDELNPTDVVPDFGTSAQPNALTSPVAASVAPRQRAAPVALAGTTTPSAMRKTSNGTTWSIQ
ncbi:hypothetical protein [Rhizobium changzhiense]|uniref:hypothetical protein n=1 Tax=Rhizobium changzhiense TaxID=2692317 RepID=UPI001FD3F134|nr:hypothetical protein [Rhizobium changzhiense]